MSARRLLAGLAVLAVAGCASSPPRPSPTTQPAGTTVPATSAPTPVTTAVPTTTAATGVTTTAPLGAGRVTFTTFLTGVHQPVEIAWRKDDTTLFLAQQDGRILPVRNGVAGAPVADLSAEIVDDGEQGLLGLAFHPTQPLAYVDYTDRAGNTSISEFHVAADGTFSSERKVLGITQPYPNHNGGKLTFGPDGMLYIGMGDGGSANDPDRRALNKGDLLGKILRIDPLAADGRSYTVPADNPYVGQAGARPEIWTIGMRNPWRFAFDRATGDLWIADVGQNQWEEVDFVPAAAGGAGRGANFGWSAFEGNHRFNTDQPADGVTPPVWEYEHGADGCSISGGQVYRGTRIPPLVGWFVVSDYCSGKVWAVRDDGKVVPLAKVGSVSAVADGPDGSLYVLEYATGTVLRIDPA